MVLDSKRDEGTIGFEVMCIYYIYTLFKKTIQGITSASIFFQIENMTFNM